MESAFIHRPSPSLIQDIAPITRRHGEAVELHVGDQVRVHFDDPLGIESHHTLAGCVVELFQHNRLKVLVGNTHFSVPAETCELIGRTG